MEVYHNLPPEDSHIALASLIIIIVLIGHRNSISLQSNKTRKHWAECVLQCKIVTNAK